MAKVEVFTDGSCWPNPGPGGWACILVIDGKEVCRRSGGASGTSTNNRMELAAILEGVRMAASCDHRQIMVVSDSKYAIGMLTKGWRAKANADLVRELRKACVGMTVHGRWVKGHSGNNFNDLANLLAEKERSKAKRSSSVNCDWNAPEPWRPHTDVRMIPPKSRGADGHDGYQRIPLTKEQVSMISATEDPILMVDQATGEEYLLSA